MPTIDLLAQECLESIFDLEQRRVTGRPLEQNFLSVGSPTEVEPWRSLLARNSAGTLPTEIPVFLAQGSADTIIRPQVTKGYVQRLCAAGSKARLLELPGVGHGLAAHDATSAAVGWIANRFNADSPPSDCGRM
jgi:acetyl esterase/lipase